MKEGSQPGNLLTRFIAFEYITAQAAARRAQNVMGMLACMAGGAQLHGRKNLIAIGGAIDTSTLAEDTYTTFKTQLAGHRVVFDGNAVVWAEEPDSVAVLWKHMMARDIRPGNTRPSNQVRVNRLDRADITFAAVVAQFRNADMRWDKTMKSGKAKILR